MTEKKEQKFYRVEVSFDCPSWRTYDVWADSEEEASDIALTMANDEIVDLVEVEVIEAKEAELTYFRIKIEYKDGNVQEFTHGFYARPTDTEVEQAAAKFAFGNLVVNAIVVGMAK